MIELAKRCLLPADAAEADQILAVLSHHGHAITRHTGGHLTGLALVSVGHRDPSAAHLDLLLVDPAYRRRGLARSILAEAEEWARGKGLTQIKVMGNPPDYAWPGVDVRYTTAVCTLQSLGYNHFRTAWNMTAALPPAPGPDPAPAGVEIRAATEDDLVLLLPMVREQWGPAWTTEVERATRGSGGVHVAWRDAVPIAFAAWGASRPSWFGPMGTLPSATGLGLGGELLRRCLADQAALGLSSAQIGWVGPLRFYSNTVAAQIERVFFLFDKKL